MAAMMRQRCKQILTMALCGVLLLGAPMAAHADSLVTSVVIDPLTGVAMDGYDPVSYFTEGQPQRGNPDYVYSWAGVPWYFASAANRDVFMRNPDVYAPQYGGHCQMSLARGFLSDGKPEVYAIEGMKLYLFYSAANREAFLLSPGEASASLDGAVATAYSQIVTAGGGTGDVQRESGRIAFRHDDVAAGGVALAEEDGRDVVVDDGGGGAVAIAAAVAAQRGAEGEGFVCLVDTILRRGGADQQIGVTGSQRNGAAVGRPADAIVGAVLEVAGSVVRRTQRGAVGQGQLQRAAGGGAGDVQFEGGRIAFRHGDVAAFRLRIAKTNGRHVVVDDGGDGTVTVAGTATAQRGAQGEVLVGLIHAIVDGTGAHQQLAGAGVNRDGAGVVIPADPAVGTVLESRGGVVGRRQGRAIAKDQHQAAAGSGSSDADAEHGIELICDDAVVLIDRERKLVVSRHGRYRRYQQLVLACGALPLTPGYAEDDSKHLLPGLCHFRNWQDLATLRLAGQQLQHAVVVGGGFLGLEAAEGLRKLGMQVSLLQRGAYLLNRQLDASAAGLLQQQLTQRGLNIITNSEISSLNYRRGQLQSVALKSGQQLKADLVVLALGISPNITLAQQAGLKVNRGIVVNPQLQSSDGAIYALGECIELNGETFGLVAPINAQAIQLAQTLCGKAASYCSENTATQLKISGIALSSCGDIATLCANPASFDACTDYLDIELNEYRRLWWRGPYLAGAVLYGDTSLSQQLSQLITQQQPYHGCRSSLVLGRVEQGIAEPGMADSAAKTE